MTTFNQYLPQEHLKSIFNLFKIMIVRLGLQWLIQVTPLFWWENACHGFWRIEGKINGSQNKMLTELVARVCGLLFPFCAVIWPYNIAVNMIVYLIIYHKIFKFERAKMSRYFRLISLFLVCIKNMKNERCSHTHESNECFK